MHAESRRHTHTSTDLISRPRAEHRRHSEHKPLSEPDEQIEKATHIENKPQNETAHTQHATTLVSVSEWCSIVSRISWGSTHVVQSKKSKKLKVKKVTPCEWSPSP